MKRRIALAGNPNSGKTTMFNALTGSSQYVGNWPGVTVEKKEGNLKGKKDVIITDLPGIYSLSPYTLEEVVARNYLLEEKPDAIINIIDATNIERNLYLTTQLLELNIPVVIALNMMDIIRKNGNKIDIEKLSKDLGCPIVETSALKGKGIQDVVASVIQMMDEKQVVKLNVFDAKVTSSLQQIETLIPNVITKNRDWYALKLFEKDEKIEKKLALDASIQAKISSIRTSIETEYDDDCESIITSQRYEFIDHITHKTVQKPAPSNKMSISDKIDKVVTNRWLALPIFAIVMFLVYSLAMSSVGQGMTDWVNDVLFGDVIPPAVTGFLESIHCADWLQSLIVDGMIAGVGSVLGFLPQMAILFLLLGILEDSGYMARIAFIMDRIFRKFGLSGKSFVPMLVATGCGVPGIMATRTIENERDRKMTIMLTTFMPCNAKLPIFALIAGSVFGNSTVGLNVLGLHIGISAGTLVAFSMYFIGMFSTVVCGIFLKHLKYFKGEAAPFIMELPAYHIPSAKNVLLHTWDRIKSFVKKAGTIILLAVVGVWFLSSFNWSFEMVEDPSTSILASIGKFIAPIFAPLGWDDWRAAVATITGLIAKENVVGTFGVLFGAGEVAEDGLEIWSQIAHMFTPVAAYSFMVFNLLCAPCFAAIGAIRREMGSVKWTLYAVGFQCAFAYLLACIINVVGNFIF